jgi:hypothetical protein
MDCLNDTTCAGAFLPKFRHGRNFPQGGNPLGFPVRIFVDETASNGKDLEEMSLRSDWPRS